MYQIGEFSRITGLSIKTLRFYHEKGLLNPTSIDPDSGYRYYNAACVERAQLVSLLREIELPISEIKQLLDDHAGSFDPVCYLEQHRQTLEERIRHYQSAIQTLDHLIHYEKEARTAMENSPYEVAEKSLDAMLVAGVRMKGKYSDCGKGFSKIGKNLWKLVCGKPFCLYYDGEYKEEDADFEACMPVREERQVDGIAVRQIPGGKFVTLIHRGPYDQLKKSYAKVFDYIEQNNYDVVLPSREVYVKGPGMIFKGNPKKYITEIQVMVNKK